MKYFGILAAFTVLHSLEIKGKPTEGLTSRLLSQSQSPGLTTYVHVHTSDPEALSVPTESLTDDPVVTPVTTSLYRSVELWTERRTFVPRLSDVASDWASEFAHTSDPIMSTEDALRIDTEPVVTWKWRSIHWNWFYCVEMATAITGIIGNFLVMLVLWRRRAVNRSTDMLIGALAVADFFTSIFIIPLPTALVVPSNLQGELYCKFIHTSYFMWLTVGASIYTLAFLAIERLIAVKYPIYFNRFFSKKHASYAIISLWIICPLGGVALIVPASVDRISHVCVIKFQSISSQYTEGITMFLIKFLIPATIMLSVQALTAYTLHRMSRNVLVEGTTNGQSNQHASLIVAKTRVLKLLFLVVLVFIICWGPDSFFFLLLNLRTIDQSYHQGLMNQILILLGFCNSCLNPIVYTIRQPKFRAAIRELFTRSKPQQSALFSYKADANLTSSRIELKK